MRRRRVPDRDFFRRYALAFGVALALVVIGIVGVNLLIEQKLSSVTRVSLQLPPAPSGGANYLMVGSDSRSFVSNAQDRQAFGTQTKTRSCPEGPIHQKGLFCHFTRLSPMRSM